MNNYEYVQENIQGQNIFDGDSNTSPDIDQLNQIINENMISSFFAVAKNRNLFIL